MRHVVSAALVCLATAACTTRVETVPIDERPCRPDLEHEACVIEAGTVFRVRCNVTTLRWHIVQTCFLPQTCVSAPALASGNPALRDTFCHNPSATVDAGSRASDAASSDVKADVQPLRPPGCGCKSQQACVDKKCVPICQADSCDAKSWCEIGSLDACAPVQCQVPAIEAPRPAWRVTGATLLPKTQGCDLDGDGKPNNQLHPLLDFDKDRNTKIAQGIPAAEFVRLFEVPTSTVSAVATPLAWYQGKVEPKACAAQATSNGPAAGCAVSLLKHSYALENPGPCQPVGRCHALWNGTDVSMTCKELPQALLPKPEMSLAGHDVTVQGVLPTDGTKGKLRICGRYLLQEVLDLIDLVPEEHLIANGLDVPSARGLVKSFFKPDLDSDGDGIKESLSFAADLEVTPSVISGHVP